MASFNDARVNTPQPTARLHRDQAGPDATTANAIEAAGQFGGAVREGQLEGQLEANLVETGNVIAAVNNVNTITHTNPDGTKTLEGPDATIQGIDQTTERFQRIASSLDQGKISQQRAALEAEVELRRSINKAPGFAQQLRKSAQDLLGFNPSGAAMEALFLSGPDKNTITQADKDNAEGQRFFELGFAKSPEDGLRLVIGERAIKAQKAVQLARISQSETAAPRIAVEAGALAQNEMNGIMLQAFAQIDSTGGVQEIEALRSGILAAGESVMSQVSLAMADAKDIPYQQAAYDNMRKEVTRIQEANIALLDNQDVMNIMSRKRDLMEAVLRTQAITLAPEVALIASSVGNESVGDYIELMAASAGDPVVMQKLIEINPHYGFLANLALDANSIAPTLQAIASGGVADLVNRGEVDPATVTAVTKSSALDLISGRKGLDKTSETIKSLSDLNLPNMVMSTAAQTRNSYAAADAASKQIVVRDFQGTDVQQRANIAREIQGTNWALGWDETKNEFIIQDRRQRPESAGKQFLDDQPFNPSQFSGVTDRAAAQRAGVDLIPGANVNPVGIATDSLKALNEMMVPLMKDPRWANEIGHVNPSVWASDFIAEVNTRTIEAELSDSGSDTVAALGFNEQVALRTAIQAGDQVEIFNVLEAAGLGKFNETATLGKALEKIGPNTYVDVNDGRVMTLGPDGQVDSVIAASGRLPTQEELEAAGPEGINLDEFNKKIEEGSIDIDENAPQAVKDLMQHEGFDRVVREDAQATASDKPRTIGHGRNIDANPVTAKELRDMGLTRRQFSALIDPETGEGLNEQEAGILFASDYVRAIKTSNKISGYEGLSDARKDVIVNMAFNLGGTGVRKFKKMWAAIEEGDFDTASAEMLDSQWARTVGNRAVKLAEQMKQG